MPDASSTGWDVNTYRWLTAVGVVAVAAFRAVDPGRVPLEQDAAIASVLVAYGLGLGWSERVRRQRVVLFELLCGLIALWALRVAADAGFEGETVLALLVALFGTGIAIGRFDRLLLFYAVLLGAEAVALALSPPPESFDRGAVFVASAVIATVSLVAVRARDRALERAAAMALVASRVHNGVIVTDPAGRVAWTNEGFSRLSGRTGDAARGQWVWDLLDQPPSAPEAVARLRSAIETAHDTRQVQLAHVLADGATRWVAIDLTPTRDAQGQLDGWILVETDIAEARAYADQLLAEREAAEVALRDAAERLRQSQKMEAVGRLAGGIAHDFNNLLAVILGYSTLVLRRNLDDRTREGVVEIQRAGERAAALTRQLLAFSRRQVLAPQVLDLGEVVRGAEGVLRRVIREDIELVVDARARDHTRADPHQIEQILLNLALNARDAMPRGGRLYIETEDVRLDDAYAASHPGARPGTYVALVVSDTGVGMTPEVLARVFEPFFTTKPPGEGTGLGLATVHGIAQQSGGHVSVYSEIGRGTTFRVYLPATDEPVTARTEPPNHADRRGTETILLAEDDPQVRRVAAEILTTYGYRVMEAGSGEGAIALLEAGQERVHLLLTDVVMAGMSGPELAKRVEELRPGIRVLYTSGYPRNAIVTRKGELLPGVALLTKPFTADALTARVREVLDG